MNTQDKLFAIQQYAIELEEIDYRLGSLHDIMNRLLQATPNGNPLHPNAGFVVDLYPENGVRPYMAPVYYNPPNMTAFQNALFAGIEPNIEEEPKRIIGYQRTYDPKKFNGEITCFNIELDNPMMIGVIELVIKRLNIRKKQILQDSKALIETPIINKE